MQLLYGLGLAENFLETAICPWFWSGQWPWPGASAHPPKCIFPAPKSNLKNVHIGVKASYFFSFFQFLFEGGGVVLPQWEFKKQIIVRVSVLSLFYRGSILEFWGSTCMDPVYTQNFRGDPEFSKKDVHQTPDNVKPLVRGSDTDEGYSCMLQRGLTWQKTRYWTDTVRASSASSHRAR